MNTIKLKLGHGNHAQISNEGLKINKLDSSISPKDFIKLLRFAENKVNPRSAKKNNITDDIEKTIEVNPQLMWLKSQGILLATENCRILHNSCIEISLNNTDFEGIMDGGHNTLAIGKFLIEKLFGKKIKTWGECKDFWDKNYYDIVSKFDERKEEFKFSIKIEIIFPNGTSDSLDQYRAFLPEICSARNNNNELKPTDQGNQGGYYDYLKEKLTDFDIKWKTGELGKINADQIVSVSTLPLVYLNNIGKLPTNTKGLNIKQLYTAKGEVIKFFHKVISDTDNDISYEENEKYILTNEAIKSGFDLIEDILRFHDRMFLEFPKLYNKAGGSFGKIGGINKTKTNEKWSVPFGTTDKQCEYKYSPVLYVPLITGLISLMEFDETRNKIRWRINPRTLDLNLLDLTQYVNIMKDNNYDPNKIGKSQSPYNEAENIFEKIANKYSASKYKQ